MKKTLFILFAFLVLGGQHLFAKTPVLSEKAQISVLTAASGDVLYSYFGHTAFRVQDPALGVDVVYNYGTFNFNRPNFYLNFTKGKMVYSLSRGSFEAFLYEYQLEKRWVKEQLLDLSPTEINTLFQFFENNYKPENRDYLYDPLFNNCSNIIVAILENQFPNQIVFNDSHISESQSYRDLVHLHIKTNSWGAFGIDLAFGGITDRLTSARERMFLPYQAMYQLQNTTKNSKPLVERERTILNYPEKTDQSTFMLSPLFWFSFLLALVIAITYIDKKHNGRSRLLDFILFFISGLAGLFILFLWLATDHVVTQLNFNFLWLLPMNLIVSFYLLSKKNLPDWLSKYLWFAIGLIAIMLIIWVLKIQILSWLNLILMLTLTIRYLFLLKKI